MKRILFISHQDSMTGAPLILLNFIEWIRILKPEIYITVLSMEEGVLSDQFKKAAHEYFRLSDFPPEKIRLKGKVVNKLVGKRVCKEKTSLEKAVKFLTLKGLDVIYANTVVTIPLAVKIKKKSPKSSLVFHIHELKTIISLKCPDFQKYIREADGVIAVSKMVKNCLLTDYSVHPEKIQVIYEFSDLPKLLSSPVPNHVFTVGGSGLAHWRKGNDIFIQIAKYIKTKYPGLNMRFVWVGGMNEKEKKIIEADIEKAGLSEMVYFVGAKQHPEVLYSSFDIFLLPSREDPFPLVCIEVGRMGKPIICFDKASGVTEILVEGGGVIVEYLDIAAMGEEVVVYYKNPEKILKHGRINKDSFSRFSAEKICPLIYSYITKLKIN